MQIEEKRIAVFFYGSFMRHDVMDRGGFHPAHIEVVKLSGFDIKIDPHANIYGILVHATHKELNSLYAMDGIGVFLPEAVNVELQNGSLLAALCYIPPARVSKPADIAYLERLITTAQEYEFPAWYVQKLKNML
jgi:hypothetical protein